MTETTTDLQTVALEIAVPGSAERPYQLLFAPVADTAVIYSRAQLLANWLTGQTGQLTTQPANWQTVQLINKPTGQLGNRQTTYNSSTGVQANWQTG